MLKKIIIGLCFGSLSILSQYAMAAGALYPGVCDEVQPVNGASETRYHPTTEGKPDQTYSAVPNEHAYTIVTESNYWNDCTVDSVQAGNNVPVECVAQDISCPATSCLGHQ